jgi:nucleoside-diphosphate-sugar epimerase
VEKDVQGRFVAANDEMPSFRRLLEVMNSIDARVKKPLMALPDAIPLVPLFDWLNGKTLGTPRIASPDLLATLRGRRWNASNRRANEMLGWRPRISLEQSLRDTMAEIRKHRAARANRSKPAPSS